MKIVKQASRNEVIKVANKPLHITIFIARSDSVQYRNQRDHYLCHYTNELHKVKTHLEMEK